MLIVFAEALGLSSPIELGRVSPLAASEVSEYVPLIEFEVGVSGGSALPPAFPWLLFVFAEKLEFAEKRGGLNTISGSSRYWRVSLRGERRPRSFLLSSSKLIWGFFILCLWIEVL